MPSFVSATAVIAAAGSGLRLGAGGPKALVDLAGRPMVAWSLEAVRAAESVGRVVVTAPPGHERDLEAVAGAGVQVVTGGASRSRSVANALEHVDTGLVVVHDAARPVAPASLFDELIAALAAEAGLDGLIAAAPLADTVKRAAGADGRVTETLDRAGLWAVQTPQAFRAEKLRGALAVDDEVLGSVTDDAALVEAAGGTVRIHPVAEPNPKVTTAGDLRVAQALLRIRC